MKYIQYLFVILYIAIFWASNPHYVIAVSCCADGCTKVSETQCTCGYMIVGPSCGANQTCNTTTGQCVSGIYNSPPGAGVTISTPQDQYSPPGAGVTISTPQDQYCTPGDPDSGILTALGCISTDATGKGFFNRIIQIIIGVSGGFALLMMLYGVFIITTSAGIPDKLKEGKDVLTSAVSGLIFIVLSVFLLQFIGINILGIPGL